MNLGAAVGFDFSVLEASIAPFCFSRPNLLELFWSQLVQALQEFLGQLGTLIQRKIEHFLREFVEVFHEVIVSAAQLRLAIQTIRLDACFLKPFDDIDIVSTGMRPGEKILEELNTEGENITETKHPKIFIGTVYTYDDRLVTAALKRFEGLAKLGREKELRAFLNEFLQEARVTG